MINNSNIKKNNNNYSNITQNKKGKIIDIDINLGKPINIINDHSPLEELFLENNEPFLFKLNTISSKFMNKNKKKNKANSGSKNKIKPPLRLKRFAEEENEDVIFKNFFIENYNYNPHLTIKQDKDNKSMNIRLGKNLKEFNKITSNFIEYSDDENKEEYIIESDKLHIRNNYFCFNGTKKINNFDFKNLIKEKNISIILINNKIKEENIINKINKKKVNKLYINCTKFLINELICLIKRKIYKMIFLSKKRFKK